MAEGKLVTEFQLYDDAEYNQAYRQRAIQEIAAKVFEQMESGKPYCVQWEEKTEQLPANRANPYPRVVGKVVITVDVRVMR